MSIKMLNRRVYTRTLLAVAVSLGLLSCSDSNNSFNDQVVIPPEVTPPEYAADIQRTEFGIPHITISLPKTIKAWATV